MTDWPKDNKGRLTKTFEFKNYRKSFAFTSQVAMLSEKKNHHPQIILNWGKVIVLWWSHKIEGLHQNDFICASKTNELYNY